MGRLSDVKNAFDAGDFGPLLDALDYYDTQIDEGQKWLDMIADPHKFGVGRIEVANVSKRLPGMMMMRYNQAQEAEAIKSFLEDKATAKRVEKLKLYKENYRRDLTDVMAGRYADGDTEFLRLKELVGEVNLRVEGLKGFTKGLEALHYQVGYLTKLLVAGIEDATL